MTHSKDPEEYTIKGVRLTCPVCSHSRFLTRETLMNTPGLTFLGLEWANRTAQNYICENCGYILWFMDD
ncbi:MAG TPA: hypothetical protein VMW76_08055 [Bacteroidales bacterium]|nr:hypothetical protein [Bacteroidales bacterium]